MSRRKPTDPGHVNLGVEMDPHGDHLNHKGLNMAMPPSPRLNINRIAYSVRDFQEEFEVVEKEKVTLQHQVSRKFAGAFSCSLGSFVRARFPILDWLASYNFKGHFLSDVLAGVTVAVFQAPQSMGYSLIAHVPPVHGLYTAFFPAIMYTLFGTSRHASIGAFAIVSGVMTGNLVVQVMSQYGVSPMEIERQASAEEIITTTTMDSVTDSLMGSATTASPMITTTPNFKAHELASAVSFIIGLMMPIASLFRLGFISIYLSDQFLSGFTTAASLYIFTSQLRYLTGVHLPYRSGYFAIIRTLIDLVEDWRQINYTCVIISLVAMAILLFSKIYINAWLVKRKIGIPFPIELLVVIGATVVSSIFDFHGRYDVPVVGYIQAGLPPLTVPRLEVLQVVGLRALPFALVGFTISLSIGKLYGSKHGYEVQPNQELLALGFSNLFGSLFTCLPSAASLPRSATQEAAGGKTQLVSIINCVLILILLMYLSPLLDQLPNCILASIIAVALRGLLAQSRQFHMYWKISKLDGTVWMITFLSVIILDVDLGLYFSLAWSLLILIYKSSRPKTYLLGPVNESDVYVPVKKYMAARNIKGIKIYQFCGPLHFASLEFFKNDMMKKIGINISDLMALKKKDDEDKKKVKKATKSLEENGNEIGNQGHSWDHLIEDCRIIIVDCSMLSYIDSNGVTKLKMTAQQFEQIGIKFFLAGCAPHVIKMLSKDHFFSEVGQNHVYIAVHDAVLVAMGYLDTFYSTESNGKSLPANGDDNQGTRTSITNGNSTESSKSKKF